MTPDLRPFDIRHLEAWRGLLAEPSIAPQFEVFQGEGGLEHKLADSHLHEDTIRLAFLEGELVGFGFGWVLGSGAEPWGMMRVGVHPGARRRGIGRAIAGAVIAALEAKRVPETLGSLWRPADDAEGFAEALGFEHERWFWMMERPRGDVRPPEWPAGVTTRVFDRSEAMLRDWNAAYNGSFIDHWRFVPSSLEDAARYAASPGFAADGLLVAYRDGEPAGFCRCERYPSRGEIGVLGTTRAARGIGLGRALLRWGVAWLESHTTTPVTLVVDGDNERALSLYRSEGFEVTRTRRVLKRRAIRA